MQIYERAETMLVRDALLTVVFDVYTNEARFWSREDLEVGRYQQKWEPVAPEVFDSRISLSSVVLDEAVRKPESIKSATFTLDDGEGEEALTVKAASDPALYEDAFTRSILARFESTYYNHWHSLCLRAGRRALELAAASGERPLSTRLVAVRSLKGETLAS